MDLFLLYYLQSISIVFAAVTGLLKWKIMDPADRPVVTGWWLILLTETLRYLLIRRGHYTIEVYNLYIVCLMWIYFYQFYSWGQISRQVLLIAVFGLTALWLADHFILNGYQLPNRRYIFRISFSFGLLLLAINCINGQIMTERMALWKNHRFLICMAMSMYYIYRILVDVFSLGSFSNPFVTQITNLNRIILHIYYSILFLAALWIPRKKKFILPS
jgi:hypothetical protein